MATGSRQLDASCQKPCRPSVAHRRAVLARRKPWRMQAGSPNTGCSRPRQPGKNAAVSSPSPVRGPYRASPGKLDINGGNMSVTKPVRKAVFPVAGMGTRFLPATKAVPKEMLPVVDKPVIQYAVEEAKEAGIEQFIFVTGRGKHVIEDHFDHAYELETLLSARDKTAELNSLLI